MPSDNVDSHVPPVKQIRRHPHLYRLEDAAEYLHLPTSDFKSLSGRWGIYPRRVGRQRMYHQRQLDRAASRLFATDADPRLEPASPGSLPAALAPMAGELIRFDFQPEPRPVIYFLIHAGWLVYIGQSVGLAGRLMGHCMRGTHFDRAYYMPVAADELDDTEASLIAFFRPPGNTMHVGRERPSRAILRRVGVKRAKRGAICQAK